MNIWILWLGFIISAAVLLALSDGVKKKSLQRIIGISSLIPIIIAIPITAFLPIEYWRVVLFLVSQAFLLLIVLRLLFSTRLRSPRSTAKDTGQVIATLLASILISFVPPFFLLWILLITILVATLVILIQLGDGSSKYSIKTSEAENSIKLSDLPTISVCIPARNETHALAECLASVLESDYPKLEVLVLDDCSQDKTSRVIQSFAHAGVRFIQGEEPSDSWLGKNQALEVLAKKSSGEYLLFMGVDTRLSADTISQLAGYMQSKKLSMVSILPKKAGRFALDSLFLTLRYFWQIATPRSVDMPVASGLWVIREKELKKLGGIKQAANHIEPERILAQLLAKKHTYRFLVSNHQLGAFYAKKWTSQVETSTRLWYPLLGMQPGRVLLAALGQYIFVFLPIVMLSVSLIAQSDVPVALLSSMIIILQLVAYGIYIFKAQQKVRLLATLFYPLVSLQEVALILASLIQYEFGTVNWKGRNICYPILMPFSWRD